MKTIAVTPRSQYLAKQHLPCVNLSRILFTLGLALAFNLSMLTIWYSIGYSNAYAQGDETAEVTVGHFASFAESVDATAVEVRVNGNTALTDFRFGDIEGPIPLDPDDYLLEVVVGDAVAISATVTLASNVSYFVAATGDGENQPLALVALVNDTQPDAENAKLRIAHFAPFSAMPEATAVDICHNDGLPVLQGVEYGAVLNPYLSLPPGDYNLVISAAGSDCAPLFDIPALHVMAGDIIDVFAVGYPFDDKAAAFPFDLKSSTSLTLSAPANVTVGHLAPFGENVAATSVSIFINGSEVLTETVFGQVVTTPLAPGRVRVDVVPTPVGETDSQSNLPQSAQIEPAISQVFTLTQGVDYSVFAIGGVNDWPLELRPLINDRVPDAANAKVRIGHFAPFAVGSTATEVAICTTDNEIVGGLAAVPYGVVTEDYFELEPGQYALKIAAPNDCANTILPLPILALQAGDTIEVFATGTNTEAFPLAPVIINEVEIIETPSVSTVYLPTLSKVIRPSIAEIASGDDRFSTLVTALTAADLAETLAGAGEFTVFAPTDDAFNALPEGTLDQLLQEPEGQLTQILLYHVLAGIVPSSALSEGLIATTLQETDLVFTLSEGPRVNDANIVIVDIYASNGVIHVIDSVLIPAD